MSISTIIMLAAIIKFMIIPSLSTRSMPIKRLILTPAVFMYLFYQTLTASFALSPVVIIYTLAGIAAGLTAGALLRCQTQIIADKHNQLITLPGSYLSLVTFTLIFAVHYWVGYHEAVYPHYFQMISQTTLLTIFALALTSSISAGANLILYYKYETTRDACY